MKTFFIKSIFLFILVMVMASAADDNGLAENYKKFLEGKLVKAGYSVDEIKRILDSGSLKMHIEFFEKGKKSKKRSFFDPELGFLSKESIDEGTKFIEEHYEILDQAEQKFGVPKEIIVAIIRIETNFNVSKGDYFVINAVGVRAYFQSIGAYKNSTDWGKQLDAFFELCRNNSLDLFDYKGSRSGAFGIVQFLPWSYTHWAVDGNGDGKINLFDYDDAILSAGNYLKEKGWRSGVANRDNFSVILKYNQDEDYANIVLCYAEVFKSGYIMV